MTVDHSDIVVVVDGVTVTNGRGPDGRPYIDQRDESGQPFYGPMPDDEWTLWKKDVAVRAEVIAYVSSQMWGSLRGLRDSWLNTAQFIFDELVTPGIHDLPDSVAQAIADNSDGWRNWRDAMRDFPGRAGLDPSSAVSLLQVVVTNNQDWPLPWPQPPLQPVVYVR